MGNRGLFPAVLALLAQAAFAQNLAVGTVLAATQKSHDPVLSKSVILLVHSDPDGVIGLILNRPTGSTYLGGPIALGVRTLFRSPTRPERGEHVAADIYMLPDRGPVPKRATAHRMYDGYTGWSVPQLTDEISRGLWKILAGDVSRIVFE